MNNQNTALRKEIICPYCWVSYAPESSLWVSESKEALSEPFLANVDEKVRFLPSRFSVNGLALDEHGVRCHDLACPACHLLIPRDLLEVPSYMLSVVGTPSSGKSYFLASMVARLRNTLSELGVDFRDSDGRLNEVIRGYERKQFFSSEPDKPVALEKTEEQGKLYHEIIYNEDNVVTLPAPFFFTLNSLSSPNISPNASSSVVMTLYDNAGESFDVGKDNENFKVTRHLAKSDAIMFLYDPTQERSFRLECQRVSNDPQITDDGPSRDERQELTLSHMIDTTRRHAGLGRTEKCGRPIIIVVTKADIWKPILVGKQDFPEVVALNDNDQPEVNLGLIRKVSDATRNLLQSHARGIPTLAESFSDDVTYIPVSATGTSPIADLENASLKIRPRDIKPEWVEVPLLYALAMNPDNDIFRISR